MNMPNFVEETEISPITAPDVEPVDPVWEDWDWEEDDDEEWWEDDDDYDEDYDDYDEDYESEEWEREFAALPF